MEKSTISSKSHLYHSISQSVCLTMKMKIYDLVRHKYPMDTFQGNINDNAGYQGLILNL